MAKYIANPVEVTAFVITHVEHDKIDSTFVLTLDDEQLVRTDPGMTSRMTPQVGDYWVIQADGYIYLNPKDVFERKYHRG